MDANRKSQSPIAWVLGQTGDHGGQYVLSVILAVIGVAFSVAPYFVVVGIVQGLMEGQQGFAFYLGQCLTACGPAFPYTFYESHPTRQMSLCDSSQWKGRGTRPFPSTKPP